MLREHMNFDVKDWEEMMCFRLFHRRLYLGFDYGVFRNLYFKDERVAMPPKCFIFR